MIQEQGFSFDVIREIVSSVAKGTEEEKEIARLDKCFAQIILSNQNIGPLGRDMFKAYFECYKKADERIRKKMELKFASRMSPRDITELTFIPP